MRKGMKKRKRSNIWNRIRAGMLAAVLTATMQTGILAAEQIEEVDRKQAEVQIQLWERSSGAETRSIEVSVMVKVEEDKKKGITSYELVLPTDALFVKVHGEIVLHYDVYNNKNIILLKKIEPESLLIEGHNRELSAYKGVMISKENAEKDKFKIDLLNMLNGNK